MALIACSECNQKVSDRATACPHCGAPVDAQRKKWTEAKAGEMPPPPRGGDALFALFGIVALIMLFIMPPVGFAMLVLGGLIKVVWDKNKVKVPIFIGKCPHCDSEIKLPQDVRAAPCPRCKKQFLSCEGRFYEA